MENKSNNKSILTKIINFIDNKINRFLVMFSIALASTLIVFSMSNSNEKEVEASNIEYNLNNYLNTSITTETYKFTCEVGDSLKATSSASCQILIQYSTIDFNNVSYYVNDTSGEDTILIKDSYSFDSYTFKANKWDVYYFYYTERNFHKFLIVPEFSINIDNSNCNVTGQISSSKITSLYSNAYYEYSNYYIGDLKDVSITKDNYQFYGYKLNDDEVSSEKISETEFQRNLENGFFLDANIIYNLYGDDGEITHQYFLFNETLTLIPEFTHIHNFVIEEDTENNCISYYCTGENDDYNQCLYYSPIKLIANSNYFYYGDYYSNLMSFDNDKKINENGSFFDLDITIDNGSARNAIKLTKCLSNNIFIYSTDNAKNEFNIFKTTENLDITGGTLVDDNDFAKLGLNSGHYLLEAKLKLKLNKYANLDEVTYKYITLKFPFEIEKCDNYAYVEMDSYDYNGTVPTPYVDQDELYEETDDITYYNTVDQFGNAKEWKDIDSTTLLPGTYYVYAKVGETKNCYKTISSAYSFTVNPLTFNPTFTGDETVTYDGSEHTISIDDNSIPADTNVVYTISSLGSELLYSCPSVVDAGTYTITYTLSKEGYTSKTITKTLTINPMELTVNGIKVKDKVFDGTLNVEFDYSDVVFKNSNGDEVTINGLSASASGEMNDLGIGTLALGNVSLTLFGENSKNYTLSEKLVHGFECNVTKAKITISGIEVKNKVFDANKNATLDLTNIKYNGQIDDYEITVNTDEISAEFNNLDANEGVLVKITYNSDFFEPTNYYNRYYEFDLENSQTIAYANITPIELELTYSNLEAYYDGNAKNNVTISYDSNKLMPLAELGEEVIINNGSNAINAGTYDVVVTWTNNNYVFTNPTATLIINKAQAENITLEHHIMNITYGDTFDSYFHVYVNREDLTNNNTDYVATYTTYSDSNLTTKVCDGLPTQAGTYYIKQVCKESLNLSEKTDSFELNVSKKDASISYSNLSAVYDSKDHMPVLTLEGILNDDVTASFKEEAAKNAGTYTYNVEFAGLVDNYNITGETSCTLTIDQREVSIKLENLTKHINLSDPKFIYTIENDLDSSELEVTISRAQGELAGKYKIDANYVSNPNYTVSSVTDDAYLTIEDHTYGDLVMVGNSNLYVRYCTNQDCCEHISQSKAQSDMKSVTSSTIISNGSTIEAASINNTEDSLKSSVFTSSEINSGNKLSTWIQISDVDADSLDSQVKSLIESSATSVNKDLSRLKFMDISMYKSISSDTSTTVEKVTSSNSDQFEITLKLPSNMFKNKYRTYKVIRVHDSNVDTLDSTLDFDNGTITFTTDRFSNYAITYEDHLSPAQISGIVALVVLVILVILYIVFYFVKYRNHKLDNSKFKRIYSLPQKKNSNE